MNDLKETISNNITKLRKEKKTYPICIGKRTKLFRQSNIKMGTWRINTRRHNTKTNSKLFRSNRRLYVSKT